MIPARAVVAGLPPKHSDEGTCAILKCSTPMARVSPFPG
jgi:hypothetical protein